MDQYARSIARVAIAQIAEVAGFEGVQESAADILADLMCRYQLTVCTDAQHMAELAGRTQMNLVDVLLALEDMQAAPEDLLQHLQLQESELPFAHTLPQIPVQQQAPWPLTFADLGETPPCHVPAWLPAFPDPHTYQHTPSFPSHTTEPTRARQAALQVKQRSEAALLKLHQRLAASEAPLDRNPFLEAPEPAAEEEQDPTAALLLGLPPAAAAALDSGSGTQPRLLDGAAAGEDQQQQQQQQRSRHPGGGSSSGGLPSVHAAFSELLQAAARDAAPAEAPAAAAAATAAAAAGAPEPAWQAVGSPSHGQATQENGSGRAGPPVPAFQVDSRARALPPGFSRSRVADAYAAKRARDGLGSSGKRSHRSRYDADPKLMAAEAILAASAREQRGHGQGGVREVFELDDDEGPMV